MNLKTFELWFENLHKEGYIIIGPTIENKAIVYRELQKISDLPQGWSDRQSPGKYQIEQQAHSHFFHFNCSPFSWKQFFFPPRQKLFSATQREGRFEINPVQVVSTKMALLGIKPCELRALQIHEKVFLKGSYKDLIYEIKARDILKVVINCSKSSETCFCTSMKTGPFLNQADGFDFLLTEMLDSEETQFALSAASEVAKAMMSKLDLSLATSDFSPTAELKNRIYLQQQQVSKSIHKTMPTAGLKELVQAHQQHPIWEKIATACLSCANCTLACPTCFCSDVEDITDLSGQHTERWKKWDSCFNASFSFIHGGEIRKSTAARYRHWLTHKLASWHDQFEESGCVGCGRCITWCPVGIDLTQVVKELG